MHLLIQRDALAHEIFLATLLLAAGAEIAATYLGQARDGNRRLLGSVSEVLLLTRRGGANPADRWTKQIVVGTLLVGIAAAYVLAADVPSLRLYADNWATFAIGTALAAAGVAVRSWAVWTLGRFFRREVTIEAEQHVIRGGPYRWVRHPAYAGNLLTYAGLGLAFGSWVGAAVVVAVALAGHIPRIRVEERELERAFGREYADYELTTARLVPRVW